MPLQQRISLLAQAMGTDVKSINSLIGLLSQLTTTSKLSVVSAINSLKTEQGELSQLQTTNKSSLVTAINELVGIVSSSGINDNDVSTTTSYSSSKVESQIAAMKASILGGTPEAAWDTLKEISDYIAADQTATSSITIALGNRLKFDALQTLTVEQQLQGCTNLGIGDPNTDFVSIIDTEWNKDIDN